MKATTAAILLLLAVSASGNRIFQRLQSVRTGAPLSVPKPGNDIDDAIIKVLETLRKLMPVGIPELGVPVLEPLKVPHYEVSVDSELAKVSITLDDLMIKNLSTFKIVKIANDMEHLMADFDLRFDRITLSGQYNLTGKAMGSLDIFGNGAFTQVVEGFDVGGTIHLTTESGDKDSPAEMDKMKVRFSVTAFKSNFENLMGGGEMGDLVNKLIDDEAPEFIKNNQEELSRIIGEKVKEMVNPVLGHFTLKEILDFLGVPN